MGTGTFIPAQWRTRAAQAVIASLALVAGCHEPAPKLELASEDSATKIITIKHLAEEGAGDYRTLAELVGELESRDPAVRFYAIRALRQITGESRGFVYYEDEAQRAESLDRWREWLKAQQPQTRPSTAPAGAEER